METVTAILIIFVSVLFIGSITFYKILKTKQKEITEKNETIQELEKQNIQLLTESKKDNEFAREKINFLEEQDNKFSENGLN